MIEIPTFKMRVIDIFEFNDGRIVIAGIMEGENIKLKLTPCQVEVRLDNTFVKRITLTAERMPGPKTPKGQRIFETFDSFDVALNLLREGRCMLIHY